jgi:radical SAM superfamily enzyme YgiQ (UPF0313 family)
MYTTKNFKVRKPEDVFAEIELAGKTVPDTRRVFLGDGNAMVLSYEKLRQIFIKLNEHLPKARRISMYALPKDILSKSVEELKSLRDAGLQTLYVGVESGDDEVLRLNNKSETANTTIDGLLKAKVAGIKLSLMILNGLGGKKYSKQHAINSARLVNQIQPEFLSTLVLSFPYGMEHFTKRFKGEYQPMEIPDLLLETQLFLSETQLKQTIFRSNHASNYLLLNGTLSKDKEMLLEMLKMAIDHPEKVYLRPERLRGL